MIYPAGNLVAPSLGAGSSTTLRVREDGTFGGDDWDGGDRHHRHRDDDGRRVEIRGSGSGLEAGADLRIRVPAGRRLAVYLAVGKVSVTNVEGELRVDAHNAPVTASGVKGELTVDVGSGIVRVTDGQGMLNVDTGSGSVEVSRFKGRDLTVDTGSGNVNGTELTAERLTVETGSGDIELAAVSAPSLSLETGSGTVRADLRTEVQSLERGDRLGRRGAHRAGDPRRRGRDRDLERRHRERFPAAGDPPRPRSPGRADRVGAGTDRGGDRLGRRPADQASGLTPSASG